MLAATWPISLNCDYTINDTRIQLDKALPRQAIDQLIDLCSQRRFDEVMATFRKLPPLPPHAGLRIFPLVLHCGQTKPPERRLA